MTTATLAGPKSPADRPRLRGWLHLYAAGAAIIGGIVLCALAATRPGWTPLASCVIYAVTTCGLFSISALYHRRIWGPIGHAVMKRLDHAMIFVFIAGTYTPFAMLLLDRGAALELLSVVWGAAIAGVVLKVGWPATPRWVGVSLYIGLGWVSVFVAPELVSVGGWAPAILLLIGGIFYTAGAVLYATKWPNPWPRWFGHHEFFHAATILAAACHYVAVLITL